MRLFQWNLTDKILSYIDIDIDSNRCFFKVKGIYHNYYSKTESQVTKIYLQKGGKQ